MKLSSILSRYIGRQFLGWFFALLVIILGVILLVDTVELLRRAAGKPAATFGLVLRMGLFKLPETSQEAFPFIVLFSAMFTFWRLTRSQELVVARAVGVSVWQFLAPVLVLAPMLGVFQITVINPVGAILYGRYEQLDDQYLKGQQSSLAISRSGLWLRQPDERGTGQWLIHAESVKPGSHELLRATLFRLRANDGFISRVDSATAMLEPGFWLVRSGWFNDGKAPAQAVTNYRVPTTTTFDGIAESLAAPKSLSFWELPRFIRTLEATGLSAVRHRLHYQSLLAQPVLFCAMVLFAAAFSLRQTRRGGTLFMVAGGIVTGFVLFLLTDVVRAFGISETIPTMLAAWTPAGSSLLIGIAVLLHLEDG